MEGSIPAARRRPVELGPVGRRALPIWLAWSIVATGVTAVAGWPMQGPWVWLSNEYLGPGMFIQFALLGAAVQRGSLFVGAFAGAVVGVLNELVVLVLPLGQVPLVDTEAKRWYFVKEAIGVAPILGLVFAGLGAVIVRRLRRMTQGHPGTPKPSPKPVPAPWHESDYRSLR